MKKSLTGQQLCQKLRITPQQLAEDAKDLPEYNTLWEEIPEEPNSKTIERLLTERQQAVREIKLARGQGDILPILDRIFTPQQIKILKDKYGVGFTPSTKPVRPKQRQRYRKQPERIVKICKRYREKRPSASLQQIYDHSKTDYSYKTWRSWLLEFTGEPLFKRGRIELLDHPRLYNELRNLERRVRQGGRDLVNHPKRMTDDIANSVCGSLVNCDTGTGYFAKCSFL